MPEYLIACATLNVLSEKSETYARKVEGIPVIIPGFEKLELFAHCKYEGSPLASWVISEVKTGTAITDFYSHYLEMSQAVEAATKILNEKDLKATLEHISELKPVKDYPLLEATK